MNKDILDSALSYVRGKFENEYSGHDYFHTLRVYRMAMRIGEGEGADLETVGLAALLHDVDDRKISPETYEKQVNARSFLASRGVAEERIDRICKIIREISFGANDSPPSTKEGKCVQDADRLDAIGAIGIGRAFAYGGSHNRHMHHPDIKPNMDMTKDEYVKSESTTVNHFYEKLFRLKELMNTSTAKDIAKGREIYMREFVDEFLCEWEGKR
jgi:uncharacterized protein